jgi:hypothetical protein
MHPIQDLFLESFSYVLQIDRHFICTPMWTKKFILVKSGCYTQFFSRHFDVESRKICLLVSLLVISLHVCRCGLPHHYLLVFYHPFGYCLTLTPRVLGPFVVLVVTAPPQKYGVYLPGTRSGNSWWSKNACKHTYEAFKIIILLKIKLLHFSLKITRMRSRRCFKRENMFAELFNSMIKGIHLTIEVKTSFSNTMPVTGSSTESNN